MTAWPTARMSPRLSPTAGLFNALVALVVRLLNLRTVELEAELAVATDLNQRLKEGQ